MAKKAAAQDRSDFEKRKEGTPMPKPTHHTASNEKNFAVIDGKTGSVTAVNPKINLSSLDDVRL